MSGELTIGAVTNDIYTTEDADSLRLAGVLPDARIRAVQTGACPHTAIRDDISANLNAVEELETDHPGLELVLVESGGDNLTATFSYGLVHRQIVVIDVAGGDKVPRKGGPGVTRSDLLVINKTDLSVLVGADLSVMARDTAAAVEWHELIVLGRTGEPPGHATLRSDVTRLGRPVLRQFADLDGTGLTAGRRVLAYALISDPASEPRTVVASPLAAARRVNDDTLLVSVLDDDAAGAMSLLSDLCARARAAENRSPRGLRAAYGGDRARPGAAG